MYAFELTEPLPWRYDGRMDAGHTGSLRNKVFLLEEVVL